MKPIVRLRWLRLAKTIALAVLLGAGAVRSMAQIITLPNGDKFQFVGVTYGTNHEIGGLPHFVDHLPLSIAQFVTNHATNVPPGAHSRTPSPALLVWFKPVGRAAGATLHSFPGGGFVSMGNPHHEFFAKLADENGVEGGPRDEIQEADALQTFGAFEVVPRRSKKLYLNLYADEKNLGWTGTHLNMSPPAFLGQVSFANPAYGHFPTWQPDTHVYVEGNGTYLVKMVADLQVALDLDKPFNFRDAGSLQIIPGADLSARGRQFNLTPNAQLLPSLGHFGWLPLLDGNPYEAVLNDAELEDAAGNRVTMDSYDNASLKIFKPPAGLESGMPLPSLNYPQFNGTPWPTESAWRLTLRIKHSSGFDSHDLVTFANVLLPPVGTPTPTLITNFWQGIPVVLSLADASLGQSTVTSYAGSSRSSVRSYSGAGIRATLTLPSNPTNVALDVLYPSTDAGVPDTFTPLSTFEYTRYVPRTHPEIQFDLRAELLPPGAKTISITAVLQKLDTFEFLIKPPFSRTNSTPR